MNTRLLPDACAVIWVAGNRPIAKGARDGIAGALEVDEPVFVSPNILIASSFLPGAYPDDPADRIIAAAAREYDCRVVTRDRWLLDYAESGCHQALAC